MYVFCVYVNEVVCLCMFAFVSLFMWMCMYVCLCMFAFVFAFMCMCVQYQTDIKLFVDDTTTT